MKNKAIKISYILLSILFIIPSIIYLAQNKTTMRFEAYYNFFLNTNVNKIISTITYLIIFITIFILYLIIIKRKNIFKNLKQILIYVGIIGLIFLVMLPWTSSDIFYYMGVGELDSVYNQNPYYITMEEYYNQNIDNIDDEILENGANNYWANTTVVYGPIAQLIFKTCSFISFKNVDICLLIFKLVNLIIHVLNCYLIYKISNRKKFILLYGLNPFILLEFIGNVHNDIIIVFLILLTIYFLTKKKNLILSIIFLALATGIKYFTIILLPVIIIYYFKNEKRLNIRFLRCIQYGTIFFIIFFLEYILYFEDIRVIEGIFAQTTKYSKSIHSVLLQKNTTLMYMVRYIAMYAFLLYYMKFCIDLITTKKIKLYEIIKKYNLALILSILALTNFQQWYLIWPFATIMWQKSDMIKNIIGISAITEIANTVYMFLLESYVFDIYYVGTIIILITIWMLITNKHISKKGEKISEKISFN